MWLEANLQNKIEFQSTFKLDAALSDAMSSIPDCVAAGYIDMELGMFLGLKTLNFHNDQIFDLLAAATAEMFQGSSIKHIEKIGHKSLGKNSEPDHFFKEILVYSDHSLHVFMRSKIYSNHVASFVTGKNANIGMVLDKSRESMRNICASM